MGNNSSRCEIKSLNHSENHWRNSSPRQFPQLQHKVLPEKNVDTKLRPTNNGEILNKGGTLSKKSNLITDNERKNLEICGSNTISSHSSEKYNKIGKHDLFLSYHENFKNRKDNIRCNGLTNEYISSHTQIRENIEEFRGNNMTTMDVRDKYKNRKKYKAPSPPKNTYTALEDTTETSEKCGVRKLRLFKTQAEAKTKKSSLSSTDESVTKNEIKDNKYTKFSKTSATSLQRTKSMPELQIEINDFKKRVDQIKKWKQPEISNQLSLQKEKSNFSKSFDNHIEKKDYNENWDVNRKILIDESNSLHRSSINSRLSEKQILPEITKSTPKKTFYFGMKEDEENVVIRPNTDVIKSYLPFSSTGNRRNSLSDFSQSDSSNEIVVKYETKDGIALHLRPILPKKQLELPRFSPATAWKMLSTVENQTIETVSREENSVFAEEKIQKLSRNPPPPILQIGSRSNNDKSGDSGISGDAGPPAYDDTPEIESEDKNTKLMLPLTLNSSHLTSWTPQQDLQEESSDEESNNKIIYQSRPPLNVTQSRRNVFSLSLPRDNRFATYIDNKDLNTNSSLRKFKNSVVGVLNNFSKKDINESSYLQPKNSNWFLSKSVPHSLNNNCFWSLDFQNCGNEDDRKFKNNQQNNGRVIYLPDQKNQSRKFNLDNEQENDRRKSSKFNSKIPPFLSKSHENISLGNNDDRSSALVKKTNDNKSSKSKRFTFQSTIRQIERRRLAEKLSKEAEIKEKQRLSEVEAMQRVEKEFQQKRAREKLNLKQKLRLFSIEEPTYFSLPYDTNFGNDFPIRPDPDGAVSSPRSSPNAYKSISARKRNEISSESLQSSEDNIVRAKATEILSEYRQMKREYKDFKSSHYLHDNNSNSLNKPTTVYPQISYNMPKAYGYQYS